MRTSFLRLRTTGWWTITGAIAWVGCSAGSAVTTDFEDGGSSAATGANTTAAGGAGGSGNGAGGGNAVDGGEPSDGPAPDVTVPPGGSVGSDCSASAPCRTGLTCSAASKCQPGGMAPAGSACVINAECAAGNVCSWVGASHQCAPAGVGVGGTACQTNAECGKDLRCSIRGFGAVCTPEGTVDVNGTCQSSAECFGGLACSAGKCTIVALGIPPFGLSLWPGTACEADTGAPISYFRVPRGAGDKDFYRLPFPNDIRMKNGHPDLSGHPTPGSEQLGFDAVDRYLRAIETHNDGFSPYTTVFFRFNTPFEVSKTVVHPDAGPDGGSASEKLDGVSYVDITKGPDFGSPAGIKSDRPGTSSSYSMSWSLDYGRNGYICPNSFAVRLAAGYLLKPGHTYALILHDYISVSPSGAPIGQDADFTAMLASTPPADVALTAAYATYQPLRDYLTMRSIAPSTIVNAAVFTVGQVGREASNVQQVIKEAPAPTAKGWIQCGAGASPCADVSGTRACGAADPAFDELQALVALPIFQSGTAPYSNLPDGHIDQAAPKVVRTEDVCLSLTVPKGVAMPANGWPVLVYAHGTGGSFRSHVNEGISKALSVVSADNTVPFAVLGIDQVEHGPRRGASTDTPDNLFYNFANPYAARDNAMQGAADQMALAKFAASLNLTDTTLTGASIKIDPAGILFWGHSQGATEGGIAGPYTPELAGVAFSGQGASLIDSLLTKTMPVNIAGSIAFALSDLVYADPTTHMVRGGSYHPVLSLLQTYLDPSDPLNHAALIAPEGPGGHHVFQLYGQGDSYATPITELTYALVARLDAAPTDPKVTTPDFPGVFPTPATGALTKNANGRLTAVVRQYAKPTGYDGHFVAYHNPLAQHDLYRFLDEVAKGTTPTVGP